MFPCLAGVALATPSLRRALPHRSAEALAKADQPARRSIYGLAGRVKNALNALKASAAAEANQIAARLMR
jgi:hypothetical protein